MVIALGGIFIYSEEPQRLARWYEKHLGLVYEHIEEDEVYYVSFPHRELDSDKKSYTVFSILSTDFRPFINDKSFTVSLRVSDLDGMVEKLKSARIVVRDIAEHHGGKYTWINDPEGNYIELWEDGSQN